MTDRTVLLVDDEEDIRLVLAISLKDMGCQVLQAENGGEAWRIFQRERPPIVVTDVKMPDMDGVELLRRIKNQDPDVEVIMITGHGDMDVAIESFRHEAIDFITKPINVEALEKALLKVQEKIEAREKLRAYTRNLEEMVYLKAARLLELERSAGLEDGAGPTVLQARFKDLFNDMPCCLTVLDRDWRMIAVNHRSREDFNAEPGGLCYEAFKKQDHPCPDCPAARTFEDGSPRQIETTLITRTGRTSQVLVWSAPIRDAGGRVTRAVVMAIEAGRLLRLHDHLSSLGLMLGSISHGIKGLLTGLDGGLYLMESGLKKADEHQIREGLSTVKIMVSRIRNMVLDILLFSKERDLKKTEIALLDLAEDVAAVAESKAAQNQVKLVRDFSPNSGKIVADPVYLRTALINVLENAVEACAEDRSKPYHQVVFSVRSTDQGVVFIVQDNGPGLDPEVQQNMFNLFFSSKGRQGTGLGLYVTDKVVRQHGGEILVDSAVGQGTRLEIRLPAAGSPDETYPAEAE
ncbi:MAG: response regulator [Thermodesulfobacteriota bacterium]